ncbi:MAG: hypothetical protein V7785_16575 [Bermanella sp.]
MNDRIAVWLVRYRIFLSVIGLLGVIALGYGVSKLYMNNSYKVFYDEDNPNRMAREFIKSTYSSDNSILFVVAAKDGEIFTRETLATIERITEQGW